MPYQERFGAVMLKAKDEKPVVPVDPPGNDDWRKQRDDSPPADPDHPGAPPTK